MRAARDFAREDLLNNLFNTATGYNGRTVQYQDNDNGKKVFGLYNEEGYWSGETTDVELALDYIGYGRILTDGVLAGTASLPD